VNAAAPPSSGPPSADAVDGRGQVHSSSSTGALTAIERRVLKEVAAYKSNRQIADQLCLSVRTIEHHRARISQKLELEGHHALLKFALEHQSEW
jgi:DNA-binding NarL/FixJ family response regulator